MSRERLNPGQRRTVEIIQTLGFGVIEHLSIRDGSPCYEPEPRIIQAIKLGSDSEQASNSNKDGIPVKKEFEDLFNQLRRIQNNSSILRYDTGCLSASLLNVVAPSSLQGKNNHDEDKNDRRSRQLGGA